MLSCQSKARTRQQFWHLSITKKAQLLVIGIIEQLILNQFIASVNSFYPALKYTWEISEHSLAFLDIKLSINDNGLSTSAHYKPTGFHNCLQQSFSHQQHVKNAIPLSQFLRLNLPNHSHHNMTICGLSLHHGNTESPKNLEQKFIFQVGTLCPHGINERLSFH